MITQKRWSKDQKWERSWHSNCINSFWEEQKQTVYARKMGLQALTKDGKFPVYDLENKSILDIGGGPYSMLLKSINGKDLTVVDPGEYPEWTKMRYKEMGIKVVKLPAEYLDMNEQFKSEVYDEAWIYNCLQHTMDPERIVKNLKNAAKIVRVFEWVNEPISIGHPQLLTEAKLNAWFGGFGKVERLNELGCHGDAYYGLFKGNA